MGSMGSGVKGDYRSRNSTKYVVPSDVRKKILRSVKEKRLLSAAAVAAEIDEPYAQIRNSMETLAHEGVLGSFGERRGKKYHLATDDPLGDIVVRYISSNPGKDITAMPRPPNISMDTLLEKADELAEQGKIIAVDDNEKTAYYSAEVHRKEFGKRALRHVANELKEGPKTFSEIASALPYTTPAIRSHLEELIDQGGVATLTIDTGDDLFWIGEMTRITRSAKDRLKEKIYDEVLAGKRTVAVIASSLGVSTHTAQRRLNVLQGEGRVVPSGDRSVRVYFGSDEEIDPNEVERYRREHHARKTTHWEEKRLQFRQTLLAQLTADGATIDDLVAATNGTTFGVQSELRRLQRENEVVRRWKDGEIVYIPKKAADADKEQRNREREERDRLRTYRKLEQELRRHLATKKYSPTEEDLLVERLLKEEKLTLEHISRRVQREREAENDNSVSRYDDNESRVYTYLVKKGKSSLKELASAKELKGISKSQLSRILKQLRSEIVGDHEDTAVVARGATKSRDFFIADLVDVYDDFVAAHSSELEQLRESDADKDLVGMIQAEGIVYRDTMAQKLGMTTNWLGKKLKALADANILETRREGKRVAYMLPDAAVLYDINRALTLDSIVPELHAQKEHALENRERVRQAVISEGVTYLPALAERTGLSTRTVSLHVRALAGENEIVTRKEGHKLAILPKSKEEEYDALHAEQDASLATPRAKNGFDESLILPFAESKGVVYAHTVAEHFGISKQTAQIKLKKLEGENLLASRREGQAKAYLLASNADLYDALKAQEKEEHQRHPVVVRQVQEKHEMDPGTREAIRAMLAKEKASAIDETVLQKEIARYVYEKADPLQSTLSNSVKIRAGTSERVVDRQTEKMKSEGYVDFVLTPRGRKVLLTEKGREHFGYNVSQPMEQKAQENVDVLGKLRKKEGLRYGQDTLKELGFLQENTEVQNTLERHIQEGDVVVVNFRHAYLYTRDEADRIKSLVEQKADEGNRDSFDIASEINVPRHVVEYYLEALREAQQVPKISPETIEDTGSGIIPDTRDDATIDSPEVTIPHNIPIITVPVKIRDDEKPLARQKREPRFVPPEPIIRPVDDYVRKQRDAYMEKKPLLTEAMKEAIFEVIESSPGILLREALTEAHRLVYPQLYGASANPRKDDLRHTPLFTGHKLVQELEQQNKIVAKGTGLMKLLYTMDYEQHGPKTGTAVRKRSPRVQNMVLSSLPVRPAEEIQSLVDQWVDGNVTEALTTKVVKALGLNESEQRVAFGYAWSQQKDGVYVRVGPDKKAMMMRENVEKMAPAESAVLQALERKATVEGLAHDLHVEPWLVEYRLENLEKAGKVKQRRGEFSLGATIAQPKRKDGRATLKRLELLGMQYQQKGKGEETPVNVE